MMFRSMSHKLRSLHSRMKPMGQCRGADIVFPRERDELEAVTKKTGEQSFYCILNLSTFASPFNLHASISLIAERYLNTSYGKVKNKWEENKIEFLLSILHYL